MQKFALARRPMAAVSYISIIAWGLSVSGQSCVVQAGETTVSTQNPIVVYTQDATAFQPGGAAQQLLQKATRQGQVRVIVGLRITTRMEHTLSPSQVEQQRQSQRQVQDAIAARVLGSATAPGVDRFDFIPYMSMFVDAAQLGRLLADPEVVNVQEDVPEPPTLTDSVPLIHAPDVWAKGIQGTGYVVAVLDTGVAKTHPMLAGKVKSEACYSTTNAASHTTSLCPGGSSSSTAAGSGVNCALTIAGCDHGTHVASIAAGNSSVRDGVARDSNLIAIKVFSRDTTTNATTSFSTDQIKGLQRVYALRTSFKIASVNMSLGGGSFAAACDAGNAARKTAIDNLRAVGIPTLIASGNNGFTGSISQPACISTAIAVGNTTKSDLIAASSNHSALVKLMAPGTNITAAVPPSGYAAKTGTSMATPHVAGAFSLLKQAKPKAAVVDILAALSCTGKTVHQREVAGGNPIELAPAKPRIDLIGAYNYLLKPPNVVRSWDFNTVKQALDWTPLIGTWSVSGGRYMQTPITTGWIGTSADNCNKSLQITATMSRIDPGTIWFSNSGIIFKTSINYPAKQVTGYWVAYNKCRTDSDGICTGNDSDPPGQAVFWRLNSFNSGTLLCQKQAAVNVNGFNTVKVVSRGSSHSYYLNGKLVCTVNDATNPTGPVMAAAFIAAGGGHAYEVDSLNVTSFDTAPAASPEEEAVMDPAALMPKAPPLGMTPAGSTVWSH